MTSGRKKLLYLSLFILGVAIWWDETYQIVRIPTSESSSTSETESSSSSSSTSESSSASSESTSSSTSSVESKSTASGSDSKDSKEESKGAPRLCALVLGGTGQVGKHLVGDLLANKQWERVVTIGRRKVEVPAGYKVDLKAEEESGRFVQHIGIDYEDDTKFKAKAGSLFAGCPFVFSCLGTTRKDAGSAEAFRKVDLHYVKSGAEAAKQAGAYHFGLVTSTGSDPNSWFLYPQTKGEIEEECKKLKFPSLGIFRPGLLDRGGGARFVEKLASAIVPSIHVGAVAAALRVEAEQKQKLWESKDRKPWSVYDNSHINNFVKEVSPVWKQQDPKDKPTK